MQTELSPRDLAIQRGEATYKQLEPCSNGHQHYTRYVDGTCYACLCAEINSTIDMTVPRTLDDALAAGQPWYRTFSPCPRGPHELLKTSDKQGRCYTCMNNEGRAAINPRAAARNAKQPWYTPIKPCAQCKTLSPRRVLDDRCSQCNPVRHGVNKARIAARDAHQTNYTPTVPCAQCNTLSPRNVRSDACTNCRSIAKGHGQIGQAKRFIETLAPRTTPQLAHLMGLQFYTDEQGTIRNIATGASF